MVNYKITVLDRDHILTIKQIFDLAKDRDAISYALYLSTSSIPPDDVLKYIRAWIKNFSEPALERVVTRLQLSPNDMFNARLVQGLYALPLWGDGVKVALRLGAESSRLYGVRTAYEYILFCKQENDLLLEYARTHPQKDFFED